MEASLVRSEAPKSVPASVIVGSRLISILARTKRLTFPAIDANTRFVLCMTCFFPAEVKRLQPRTNTRTFRAVSA
jgi:hypothetical protein